MIQLDAHIKTLAAEFNALLDTKVMGRHVRFLESTDSTNAQAMRWANDMAPEGSLVLAEHQTAGRGRHGRTWETVQSTNLLFSIILRPQVPPSFLSLITIAASVALSDTINHFIAPVQNQIKWPNDILINDKKCCGMLLESAISVHNQHENLPVILGIGVNVNQEQFSATIASKTTSLLLEGGRHMPRMNFLTQFLARLEATYFSLSTDDNTALLQAYQSRMAFLNEETTLQFIGRDASIKGIMHGITKTGALQLLTKEGLKEFHAGEVTSQRATNIEL